MPKVSIGLPVYNGQRYVAAAIDSVLRQSFSDFELIVSDNASTDDTFAICTTRAAMDPRLHCHRAERNHGAAWNFNRVLELARGPYFMWLAHDDLLGERTLESCANVLDADASVVLAFPRTRLVDAGGVAYGEACDSLHTDARAAHVRFKSLVDADHRRHLGTEVFGMTRTALLRKTGAMQAYAHADRLLLAKLTVLGRFRAASGGELRSRDHAERSMRALPSRPSLLARVSPRLARLLGTGPLPPAEWFDPRLAGRILLPDWRRAREYWRAAAGASSTVERARCRAAVLAWTIRNAPRLGRDLVKALDEALARVVPEAWSTRLPAAASRGRLGLEQQ